MSQKGDRSPNAVEAVVVDHSRKAGIAAVMNEEDLTPFLRGGWNEEDLTPFLIAPPPAVKAWMHQMQDLSRPTFSSSAASLKETPASINT